MRDGSPLRPRPRGMTVGRWMLVAIACALLFTLARIRTFEPKLQMGLAIGLSTLAVARILVLILYAKRCVACGRGPVAMVAAVPFGDHYYRCVHCGQRSKRLGLGKLYDASGPEDARRFQAASRVETWADAPVEPTPDRPETLTVGRLLAEKLGRDAENPPQAVAVGTIPRGESPAEIPAATSRAGRGGVRHAVIQQLSKTWDAIRWARRSRR